MNRVTWGSRQIVYSVERVNRKTVAITVKPDSRVSVRAPLKAEDEAVTRIIQKRASWIVRQQRFFEQFQPRTPMREYIGGETHLYLGRRYRLRLREGQTKPVGLINGYLWVSAPDPKNATHIKDLLDAWYLERAHEVFKERLRHCQRYPAFRDLLQPVLVIRRMSKRWGSCSPSGIMSINPDLIRAPRICIDYVIIHELCHRIHHNHSRDFYNLLSVILPDWEERKMRLERLLS